MNRSLFFYHVAFIKNPAGVASIRKSCAFLTHIGDGLITRHGPNRETQVPRPGWPYGINTVRMRVVACEKGLPDMARSLLLSTWQFVKDTHPRHQTSHIRRVVWSDSPSRGEVSTAADRYYHECQVCRHKRLLQVKNSIRKIACAKTSRCASHGRLRHSQVALVFDRLVDRKVILNRTDAVLRRACFLSVPGVSKAALRHLFHKCAT